MKRVQHRKIRKKRKMTKMIEFSILALILIVIVVIAVFTLSQRKEKVPADQYFEIINPTVDYWRRAPEDPNALFIQGISFTLKAVGGDAHSIIVNVKKGLAEPVLIPELQKNETYWVQVIFKYDVLKYGNETVEIPVEIICDEAEGIINLYF
ncbi:hypothetical protein DRO69_12865 [Candidatus Bathyarchaeota archaeon]|nr:MAG: hypothetical protein DRO69_12865 [Candidatus Bathyarchaeota archaeon]